MPETDQTSSYFIIHEGESPLVATAIHDGHSIRDNVNSLCALSEQDRLREEDPFTATWTSITDNQIIGLNSRFELDLNRPRHKAIYRKPEDAWGLQVWKDELPEKLVEESLAQYDRFYEAVRRMLQKSIDRHGCLVVYDLHTYNHKREGAEGPEADPKENPEVNLGTGNMNRQLWAPVVDAFTQTLQGYDYQGRRLDVRENVKFEGGHFMRWLHDTFPDRVCAISIEFKKFFMDEWTGTPDENQVQEIKKALQSTIQPVLAARERVCQTLSL
ncbi:N-formylglutamate amidohydrolase [Pontibacter roseus]|uniref:N-formylglutamate amidohydrolase n=1 Tax=Pontibacter roseus TaxID=336989 RepID=UPI00037EDF45|nr:N-formylglutamate amidohydrolase [Pontibacter roseus]